MDFVYKIREILPLKMGRISKVHFSKMPFFLKINFKGKD